MPGSQLKDLSNRSVMRTVTPANDYQFSSWINSCANSSGTCSVTMNIVKLSHFDNMTNTGLSPMLTAQMVAEAAAASQPVHVFDPIDMRLLYQNPASLELLGTLASFKAFLALRDTRVERSSLRHVLHLQTRRGTRAFFLHHREQETWVIHLLCDVTALDTDLDSILGGRTTNHDLRMLDRRALSYALAREMARAERNHQCFQVLRFDVRVNTTSAIREAADYAVSTVADILQSSIRQIDIIGHYDIGTLVLILPETDAPGGQLAAVRLHGLICAIPLYFAEHPLTLEIAVGGAQFRPGDTPQSLLQRAADAQEWGL